MQIRPRVQQGCFFCLMAVTPLVTRTPAQGFGGESLQYLLWSDFVLYLLLVIAISERGMAFLCPRSSSALCLLTIGFLGLVGLRYVSIFLGSLAGDSFTAYLFSGSIWIQPLLLICLSFTFVRGEVDIAQFRKWFLFGTFITVCIGLLEMMRIPAILDYLNSHYGTLAHVEAAQHAEDIGQFRLTSTFDRNPHGFALHLMMSISWITATLSAPTRSLRTRKIWLWILLLGSVTTLLGTVSTLGLVATFCSITLILGKRNQKNLITILLSLVGIGLFLAIILDQIESASLVKINGLFSMITGGEVGPSSFTDRWAVWVETWKHLTSSIPDFLFGLPFNQIVQEFSKKGMAADSDYLSILLYQGLAGLFMFLWICKLMYQGSFKVSHIPTDCPEKHAIVLTAQGVLLGMMAAGFAGGFISGAGTAWRTGFIFFALIGGALGANRQGDD